MTDRAELLATASGTGEEDRVQEKAIQAMTVLSEVQFDWQIVVEMESRTPSSPPSRQNKNSNTAMSETRK